MTVKDRTRETHKGAKVRRHMAAKKVAYCAKLAELRKRSGLSGAEVAKRLGYNSSPGYYRYEQSKEMGENPIPVSIVRRLVPIFTTLGNPPITTDEVLELAAISELPAEARPVFRAHVTEQEAGAPLTIRYKIQPNNFQPRATVASDYGQSVLNSVSQYEVQDQFAVLTDQGEQLQCIEPAAIPNTSSFLNNRRVVIAVPYKGTELVELVVARGLQNAKGAVGFVDARGAQCSGDMLACVIGSFKPE